MRTIFLLFFVMLATLVVAEETALKIDADFSGGNIQVLGIEGDTVRLKQELRDTKGFWFYWSFRVRGAEGRTLNFEFTEGVVGARGPAVSADGGETWRWLGPLGASNKTFHFTFGPEDKDVLFGMGMNYTEKDFRRFMAKHRNHPAVKLDTLCKTPKGRDVERIRIVAEKPTYKVYLSARNHCCEMMANYALEGIIDFVLSDTPEGRWLREKADFFIVPFVDKDGVEEGDQGKNRQPHDHNRDYRQAIYPTVRAIKEQVPPWLDGKPIFVLDMHCPWLRGGDDGTRPEKGTNEYVYFVGLDSEFFSVALKRFGEILEAHRRGPIPYREVFNLPFGKSWNKGTGSPELQKCCQWGSELPGAVFASSIEVPYANAFGVEVTAESARALGRDLGRTIKIYLETLPSSP